VSGRVLCFVCVWGCVGCVCGGGVVVGVVVGWGGWGEEVLGLGTVHTEVHDSLARKTAIQWSDQTPFYSLSGVFKPDILYYLWRNNPLVKRKAGLTASDKPWGEKAWVRG